MRQTEKQEKNYTNTSDNNDKSIDINSTSLLTISIASILRVQKLAIIKSKEYLSETLNCV